MFSVHGRQGTGRIYAESSSAVLVWVVNLLG
jgi:hypothetical protein